MFVPYHKHFFMKAYSFDTVKEERKLKAILRKLVRFVRMQVATAPQAKYVSEEGNEGLTGSIGLYTSHASVHIWDDSGLVMFDLYSCKDFDTERLIKFLVSEFKLITTVDNKPLLYSIVDRDNPYIYENTYFNGINY